MGLGLDRQRGDTGVPFLYLTHYRFASLASEIQLKFNMGLEHWKSNSNFRRENPD